MKPALQIPTRLGITGHFRLVVSNGAGDILREREFDNLLLDAGLNRLGTDAGVTWCAIGTGTSVPLASQTTLQSQSAATDTALTGSAADSGGVAPYWTAWTFAFRFPIGALNGNYSEIGVGWSNTLMSSRALILDVAGNPTTITVGAGEQLDVYYTRRIYPRLTDAVFSATISGVSTTITQRSASAGSSGFWDARFHPLAESADDVSVFSGGIGALTGNPSGAGAVASSVVTQPYSNNSLRRSASVLLNTAQGNFPGGIASALVQWRMAAFQYGFNPPIAKTADLTLALEFAVTWARR